MKEQDLYSLICRVTQVLNNFFAFEHSFICHRNIVNRNVIGFYQLQTHNFISIVRMIFLRNVGCGMLV